MSNMKFYRFGDNIPRRTHKFELGKLYSVGSHWYKNPTICEFIKVTPKGFNLLVVYTAKCLLKHHLYAKKYTGKTIPIGKTAFSVNIPNWIDRIEEIPVADIA